MNIAFFDFDGTITNKDTLIHFIIFAVGYKTFLLKLILIVPWLLLYAVKLLPNWRAKEKVLSIYFQGWDVETFNQCAFKYATEHVPLIVKSIAIETINEHKEHNDIIVVVSASCENWLKPWCDLYNLDCVATCLEVKDQKITGKFLGKNCYGSEKVERIRQKYNLKLYKHIYAYADSSADRYMMDLADIRYYKWERIS